MYLFFFVDNSKTKNTFLFVKFENCLVFLGILTFMRFKKFKCVWLHKSDSVAED